MTNSIVTPENTKKIAAWMEYETHFSHYHEFNNKEKMVLFDEGCHIEYNPITDAEQSRALEKKLLKITSPIGIRYKIECLYKFVIVDIYINISYRAETLELAIYKTALMEAEK